MELICDLMLTPISVSRSTISVLLISNIFARLYTLILLIGITPVINCQNFFSQSALRKGNDLC